MTESSDSGDAPTSPSFPVGRRSLTQGVTAREPALRRYLARYTLLAPRLAPDQLPVMVGVTGEPLHTSDFPTVWDALRAARAQGITPVVSTSVLLRSADAPTPRWGSPLRGTLARPVVPQPRAPQPTVPGMRPNLRAALSASTGPLTASQISVLYGLVAAEDGLRVGGALRGLPRGVLAAIAWRESRFDRDAQNAGGDAGVFQINVMHTRGPHPSIAPRDRFDIDRAAAWTAAALDRGIPRDPEHPLAGALTQFGAPGTRGVRPYDLQSQAPAILIIARNLIALSQGRETDGFE